MRTDARPSVESTSTRLPAQGADAAAPKGAKSKGAKGAPKSGPNSSQPSAASGASSTESDTEKTAVRPGLGERIQAKLSGAADEHRANADAEVPPPLRPSTSRSPGRAGPGCG